MKLFDSFSEWWRCVRSASRHIALGMWLAGRSLIIGLVSLLRALWRRSAKAVGSYPDFALGAFLLAILMVWLFTFATMRARAVGAEDRLEAVSYEYQTFRTTHGYE